MNFLFRLCLVAGGIISTNNIFLVVGFSPVGRGYIHHRRSCCFQHPLSKNILITSTRSSSRLLAVREHQQDQHVALLERHDSVTSEHDHAELLVHDVDAELIVQGDDEIDESNDKKESNETNRNMARLLLIVAAALYGTNFTVVKMLGQTDMSIALSATLRFGLAALVTSPWLFEKTENSNAGEQQQQTGDMDYRTEMTLRGMEVGFWNSAGYIAQAVGLGTTLASKSAFLCSLAVVTVPLLDYATGKRLERRQITGIVLALLGVAVLELGGLSASDLALTSGDLASMVQPLAFGVAFWRMEKAMHKYPEEAKRATAAQLLAVFLGSAAYGVVTNPGFFDTAKIMQFASDPTVLFSLFWTGCITTALTIYMESTALKSLSAAETTLILSTEPLWGTAFAAVVLGEQIGIDTGIGAVLIISACLISNLGLDGIRNLLAGPGDKFPNEDKENGEEFSGLVRGGFLAAAGSSFLGAVKSTVMQIQDILVDILPQGPPDL